MQFQKILKAGVLGSLLLASQAYAALPASVDVNTFKPSTDGGDYFTIGSSQTLKAMQANMGFYFDYADRPLQFVGTGAAVGTNRAVIERWMTTDLYGAFGFTDWFDVGMNVPIVMYNWFNTLAGVEDNGGGMGDMTFNLKFRLINNENGRFGLSVQPLVTLPTGDYNRFTGNGGPTGGLNLIADVLLGDRFTMALNLGAIMRDDLTVQNVRLDDYMTYGVAGQVKFTENFRGIIEAYGSTVFREFFSEEDNSPLQAGAGIKYLFGETGLAASLGGTFGLLDGVGSPRFRVFSGLNWTSPATQKCPECAPPAPPPDPRIQNGKIVIWGKIFFDTDKAIIKPISFPVLDDVVDVMVKNPHLRLVEVQGHTDIRGGDAYNMKLSNARANSVRDYLIGKGIEASRLTAVGYGLRRPIADNTTKEGMSQNRRVEFVILDDSGASSMPAPAPVAGEAVPVQ